jgi:hypothetical protein
VDAYFLINTLCVEDINFFMCGASLSARAFMIILMKERIRLIGLKFDTASAPSFLGRSTMFAVLIIGRHLVLQ